MGAIYNRNKHLILFSSGCFIIEFGIPGKDGRWSFVSVRLRAKVLRLDLGLVPMSVSATDRTKLTLKKLLLIYYYFGGALGLCFVWTFSSCREGELLLVVVCGLLNAVASLVVEHRVLGCVVAAHGLSSHGAWA